MQVLAFEDDLWARMVERLGGAERLELSAREHGALVRKRGVDSAQTLLRSVLAYGPGGLSLRQVEAQAAARGIAEISDVAWMNRFRGCEAWLMALVEELLAKGAAPTPRGEEGPVVRLVDASRIEGPGETALRLHLCWDASRRRICDLALTGLDQGERLDRLAFQPGEIRIGDAGLTHPGGLQKAQAAKAEVLVRVSWKSLRLLDAQGQPLDWLALCQASHEAGGLDMPVTVTKPRGRFEPLSMRLVIRPKPPQTLHEANRRIRRSAAKGQRKIDPRTLACAEHMILLTSLSQEAFPPEQLYELYRFRWQIELAFKRLKSILRIDRLPAKSNTLARAWIAAHLLFALLLEDTAADLAGVFP